ADGCLGSICSFTRPLVAFSTCCPQTARTSLVNRWLGDTQLDMVKVVCAATGRGTTASARPPRTEVPTSNVQARRGIGDILPTVRCPSGAFAGAEGQGLFVGPIGQKGRGLGPRGFRSG